MVTKRKLEVVIGISMFVVSLVSLFGLFLLSEEPPNIILVFILVMMKSMGFIVLAFGIKNEKVRKKFLFFPFRTSRPVKLVLRLCGLGKFQEKRRQKQKGCDAS